MFMPAQDQFQTPEAPLSVWQRIVTRLADFRTAWLNRRAVGALLEMDERMLRDIGLTRSDVTSALSARAGEDPSVRLAATRSDRRAARRPAEGGDASARMPGIAHFIGIGAKRSL